MERGISHCGCPELCSSGGKSRVDSQTFWRNKHRNYAVFCSDLELFSSGRRSQRLLFNFWHHLLYHPDSRSSDQQRWPPLPGVYILQCWLRREIHFGSRGHYREERWEERRETEYLVSPEFTWRWPGLKLTLGVCSCWLITLAQSWRTVKWSVCSCRINSALATQITTIVPAVKHASLAVNTPLNNHHRWRKSDVTQAQMLTNEVMLYSL